MDYLLKFEEIDIEKKLQTYLETLKQSIYNKNRVNETGKKVHLVQSLIPLFSPLSKNQFKEILEIWPCFFLARESLSSIQIDTILVQSIFSSLHTSKNETLLYDPTKKSIICTSSNDSTYNPLNHSIMKIIHEFSKTLKREKDFSFNLSNEDNSQNLIGTKRDSPYQSLFHCNEQYYCKDLVIFTLKEPCIMCAMALSNSYF